MPRDLCSWVRFALVAAAVVLGIHVRIRGLADLPLFGDEHHTLLAADSSLASILTTFDLVGSHVPLPLLQHLSLDLFGPGVVPFRLVAIVPGVLTLVLAYPLLARFVERDAAALATFWIALNPMVVYYARFARGYALALFLALVLGWALQTLLESDERPRRAWWALVLTAALLPWVHLSTLGFVAAMGLAAIARAARRSRELAFRMTGALAAAAVIAVLLFVPVMGQVLRYFREMEPEPDPESWFGIPTLLAGGPAAAAIALVALPASLVLSWRDRRAAVLLTLAAVLGPFALLLVTRPRGMDYAWARYVLSALPFCAAFVAQGFVALGSRLPRALGGPLVLALGALLGVVQLARGPLCDDARFSNSYLAMQRLAAFDEPFPETPEFYRRLAEDPRPARIVESPPIYTRGLLLYRNYALQHGREVLVGWTGELPRGVRSYPYVRLLEVEPGQADYIVLHRDQFDEVMRYFRFVFEEAWPRLRNRWDDTLMRRQETVHSDSLLRPDKTDPIASRLRDRYGQAYYKDDQILVWKLTP